MYDRETNTLWSQLTGKPIVGPLVGTDVKLDIFPVALTTWGEWLQEHPDTTVLSLETGYYTPSQYQREDDDQSIYFEYRENPETVFPVWNRDDRLDTKAEVLGLTVDDVSKAYPIAELQTIRILHDEVNGLDVVVIASAKSMEAQVYESGGMRFALPDDAGEGLPNTLIGSDGSVWRVTTDVLVNVENTGQRLRVRPTNISFWFGWFTFHPDTLLFGDE